MSDAIRKLALPIVVLGFYPLADFLAASLGGPDLSQLIWFVWSLALALSFVLSYRKMKV